MANLQLDVTFRNIDSSPALKEYAREKVERVGKYVDRPMEAHVVLFSERHEMHADIQIHVAQADLVLRGKARHNDLYAAVDVAADKIERQVRRYKDKLKDHKPSADGTPLKVRHGVYAPDGLLPESVVAAAAASAEPASAEALSGETVSGESVSGETSSGEAGSGGRTEAASSEPPAPPRIIRNTEFFAKPMGVHEAVMQMDLMNAQFLVFRNAQTADVNVVYRRSDGNIGLIEASRE